MPTKTIERAGGERNAAGREPGGARWPVGPWVYAAAAAAAAAMATAAVVHPVFRGAEGELSGPAALPMALAAAVLAWGGTAGTSWARAGRWAALAVAGQASSLQLIRAGNLVGHQHYAPPGSLVAVEHAPALAILALQTVVVLWASASRVKAWASTARTAFGGGRLLVVAAVFVLGSAALSASMTVYAAELVLASSVQLINLLTIVLLVAAVPTEGAGRIGDALDARLGRPSEGPEPGGVDGFALVAAAWVLMVCAALAWFSYQAHPHVPDEVVYLYHARYFGGGMLSLPLPPVPAAFELDLMTYEADRWYSPVPPGWPAALAVGAYFGAAWLVNPVLNAVNVLLAYMVLRELQDRRTARLAIVLLAASPWFLFMGMNLMTHTFTLTCALVAAVAVARLRRGRSVAWAVPGGIGIGITGLIRPLEGLTIAVLLGFWSLGAWPWTARRLARACTLAVVSIAAGAVTLPYNNHLAGDPLTFPLMAYTDSVYGPGVNALGFGPDRGIPWPGLDPFPGHGARDVIVNANLNTHSVNIELLGWSIGSLLPLALLLAGGRMRREDVWLAVVIAAIIGVHSFYWFSGGPDFGARYWYLIIVPCIALTARALVVVPEGLMAGVDGRGQRPGKGQAVGVAALRAGAAVSADAGAAQRLRSRVLAGGLVLSAVAVICFVPWRAMDKYHHYRGMRPDVRRLAAEHEFGRSLVLVRGRRFPDYASAAIYNPLDPMGDAPVYIWDRDPDITRAALLAYEDRPVWIIDGPSVTGAGFAVAAGPMPAAWLLPRVEDGGP